MTEFIAKDLHPISVVDDTGFLNLMKVTEPRCVVPRRATVTKLLNQRYTETKTCVQSFLSQSYVSLTTDMWTSRAGNGYISLTTLSVLPTFEGMNKNLMTRHLLGEHDHTHIAEALQSAAEEWGIDL